jgi:hypothetical protein
LNAGIFGRRTTEIGPKDDMRGESDAHAFAIRAQPEQRLSIGGDGLIVYELKRSFSDGTTHVLFEPHDFIARLAALVPRTRAAGVVGQRNPSPSQPLALDFKHTGWRFTSCARKTYTPSTLPIVSPHTARCRPEPTPRAIAGIARWARPTANSSTTLANEQLAGLKFSVRESRMLAMCAIASTLQVRALMTSCFAVRLLQFLFQTRQNNGL